MTPTILPYDFDPGFMPICNRECPSARLVDERPPAYSCRFYCARSGPCGRYDEMVATWTARKADRAVDDAITAAERGAAA